MNTEYPNITVSGTLLFNLIFLIIKESFSFQFIYYNSIPSHLINKKDVRIFKSWVMTFYQTIAKLKL